MSEPKRLVEYHDDADVLGALRCGIELGPPPGAKRRVLAALVAGSAAVSAATVATDAAAADSTAMPGATGPAMPDVASGTGASGTSGGAAASAGVGGGATVKWLAALSVTGVLAVGGYQLWQDGNRRVDDGVRLQTASVPHAPDLPPAVAHTAPPLAEADLTLGANTPPPPAIVLPAAPPRESSPPKSTRTERPKSAALARVERAPATSPAVQVESEAVLVLEARRELRNGNPERALQLLGGVPRAGLLAQEREVLEIEALCQLDKLGLARERVASFAKRYPASPHTARLERLVE